MILITALFAFLVSGCSTAPVPQSAEELVALSIEAHGGDALTGWNTMIIKGETEYPDLGKLFRAEYLVYAEAGNKVRVEQDLTKFERGRLFFTSIYNDGTGWMQRNLKPAYNDRFSRDFKRNLSLCCGIKYYADNYDLTMLEDEQLDGRDVYVLSATTETDTTKLFIDKKDFYLVREEYPRKTRIYSDFKDYGDLVLPAKTVDVIVRQDTMRLTTHYNTVEFDVPIESWMFTEDMPKTAVVK